MRKQKENMFNEKFRLLCSQTSSQDIHWSSSESSEYENVYEHERLSNLTHKTVNSKRKRKKKVSKNISNLDITYIDNHNNASNTIKNELLHLEIEDEKIPTSPILMPTQCHKSIKYNCKALNSPIIHQKSLNQSKNISKSPILVLKSVSPKYSPKVRKKLFKNNEINIETTDNVNCVSESVQTVGYSENFNKFNVYSEKMFQNINCKLYAENNKNICDKYIKNKENNLGVDKNQNGVNTIKKEEVKENNSIISSSLDDSIEMLKPSKLDLNLVNKVKSYFDGHFSSENVSQHSISDILTPRNSSKSSEDVDIVSIITQVNSNKNSLESEKEEITNEGINLKNNKSKKVRYKKDGLAYRLNGLIKKHKASISLWHHEKFLATNSNFVIPKGEHVLFQIRNVQFQYGCILLEVRDVNSIGYLVLINGNYVNDNNIFKDVIFKLYEPYKILEFNSELKLIINVCKFECVAVNV